MALQPGFAPAYRDNRAIRNQGNLHGHGVPQPGHGAPLHGGGAPTGPSQLASGHADANDDAGPSVGFRGRVINKPFQERDDIGEIGILNGNFGPERNDRRIRDYTRENLRKSPASIISLQEADYAVGDILSSEEPVAPRAAGAPAVAGQAAALPTAGAPAVAGQAGGATTLASRAEAKYLVAMGTEHANTLLTAVRHSLATGIECLKWYWHLDGTYRKHGTRKPARTRVLITEITWRRRTAQMSTLRHANVHFHHETAKKGSGLAAAHAQFFENLHQMLVEHEVRIMSGDFNMSVFQVVSILRRMGLIIDTAAIYPWRKENQESCVSDSSAIFLIGGCQNIILKFNQSSFDAATVVAPDATTHKLDVFQKGQGYALTSYLPENRTEFADALEDMFTKSTDINPQLLQSQNLLPKWKQKLVNRNLFDPHDRLFRGGAHMPLLGFLGNFSTRSDERLLARETRNREKLTEKRRQAKANEKADDKPPSPEPEAAASGLHGHGAAASGLHGHGAASPGAASSSGLHGHGASSDK